MYDRVLYEDPFMLTYCLERYKTQKMCNEAAKNCLRALNDLYGLLQVKSLKSFMMLYSLMMIYLFWWRLW